MYIQLLLIVLLAVPVYFQSVLGDSATISGLCSLVCFTQSLVCVPVFVWVCAGLKQIPIIFGFMFGAGVSSNILKKGKVCTFMRQFVCVVLNV